MLKIGWGRREISLQEPINLFGQMYMRISEGILDPCYVTAMCVDGGDGQDAVVFCSCDMEGMRSGFIEETKEAVKALCPEIPVEAVILNVTHTHSSGDITDTPDTAPDGAPIYSGRKFRAFVAKMCAEAISEAWHNRCEGGIAYGYGYAVVGHSRRVIYLDDMGITSDPAVPNGHGIMYGHTDRDNFSHYEAGADHFLNLMFTFDREKKLTGIVVNVPCPSQTSENFMKMSADYWAEVRDGIADEFGPDVYVLPQCAAAGDLSPRILHYKEAQKRRMELKYGLVYDELNKTTFEKAISERRDIAERILVGIREVYDWAKKDIRFEVPIYHMSRKIDLERRKITETEMQWSKDAVEKLKKNIPDKETSSPEEYRKAMSNYETVKGRNERILEKYRTQEQLPPIQKWVHAVRIGDIAITTTSFELYMDYMHRVQARSPYVQTFVVQLAGDEDGSYLSTERGTSNKGYSASMMDNAVSFQAGQHLVNNMLEMLNILKKED